MMQMINENSNLFKIVVIVLLLLVLVSIITVAYFVFGGKGEDALKQIGEESTIELEEFVVNLKPSKGKTNYLKVSVALMSEEEAFKEAIEANTNKVRDVIVNILRSKTADEVLDVEKEAAIKKNMVTKLNETIGADLIKEVYFTDLVVQ